MSVTVKDIAREAGTGTSTVSAYLNGRTIRPANRRAIELAINKLGYIRNDYARGLKTKKSMTVGIVMPELSNTFGATIITALEEKLSGSGYGVLVSDYAASKRSERQTVDFLMSKMVDGLVVIMPDSPDGAFLDGAVAAGIPVVVIDRLIDRNDVVQVIVNNREISRTATEKILAGGHRNIGIITGDQSIFTAFERHEGYAQALRSAGCYDPSLVLDGGLTVEGGYLAMKKLSVEHPGVTAVFVTNYEMTVGAIIAANELGLKVGTGFAFVGFDNLGLSSVVTPRLAAVEQPMKEMGVTAASMLLSSMSGETVTAGTITLSARFDEGQSIGRITVE